MGGRGRSKDPKPLRPEHGPATLLPNNRDCRDNGDDQRLVADAEMTYRCL
jgi:hypothetical protein